MLSAKIFEAVLAFSVVLVCVIAYIKFRRRPPVECKNCGWVGKEEDLNAFATEDFSEAFGEDFRTTWYLFCPKCHSSKIVHNAKKITVSVLLLAASLSCFAQSSEEIKLTRFDSLSKLHFDSLTYYHSVFKKTGGGVELFILHKNEFERLSDSVLLYSDIVIRQKEKANNELKTLLELRDFLQRIKHLGDTTKKTKNATN